MHSKLICIECCILVTLAVANRSLAIGPTLAEGLPAPYPATDTPEPLPLELGPPLPEPVANRSETEAIDLEVTVAEEPKWYHPGYWLRPPGWDTAIELGLNGSSGTSESMSLRAGGYIKRETEHRKVDFDIYHNRTHSGGLETQNNAQSTFRHDWLMSSSPWTLYVQSQLYYDEFQNFDLNLNINGGFGYRFLDTDWVEFAGRVGSGASREFGGPQDEWVPEAQFGLDFEQNISDTQQFTTTVDYYPQWGNFGKYRLLTEVGYEVELMVPSNVSLKIAANNRYDSHPDGADPNNLNYSVLLLWKM